MWENIGELSNYVGMNFIAKQFNFNFEYFSAVNRIKNVIQSGGWVELCWNDFVSRSSKTKKVRKRRGVVQLCWNEFHSEAIQFQF